MKKATIEASAPRAYFVCASCAAENLPFHDGPKKCARHDPGRNHYRRLREEMERIAEVLRFSPSRRSLRTHLGFLVAFSLPHGRSGPL